MNKMRTKSAIPAANKSFKNQKAYLLFTYNNIHSNYDTKCIFNINIQHKSYLVSLKKGKRKKRIMPVVTFSTTKL